MGDQQQEGETYYTTTPEGLVVDEDFDEENFLVNPVPEPTALPEDSLFRCWRCNFNSADKDTFYAHFKDVHGSQYSIHTAAAPGSGTAAGGLQQTTVQHPINSTWLAALAVGNRCVDCNKVYPDIASHVKTVHMNCISQDNEENAAATVAEEMQEPDVPEQGQTVVQVVPDTEVVQVVQQEETVAECPQCYGMQFTNLADHMRTVHNQTVTEIVPEDQAEGDEVEDDTTYVVIEEDVAADESAIQLGNKNLQLIDNSSCAEAGVKQFRIEPADPPSPVAAEITTLPPTETTEMVYVSEDVLADQNIVITVLEDTADFTTPTAFHPQHPRKPRRPEEKPPSAFLAERERNRQFISYKTPDGTKMFSCSLCQFETKFGGTIHDHINAIHRKIKHKCTVCDFETMYLKTLNYHRTKKHGVKAINCPMPGCKFKSIVEDKLKVHMTAKHSLQEFTLSPSKITLRQH